MALGVSMSVLRRASQMIVTDAQAIVLERELALCGSKFAIAERVPLEADAGVIGTSEITSLRRV